MESWATLAMSVIVSISSSRPSAIISSRFRMASMYAARVGMFEDLDDAGRKGSEFLSCRFGDGAQCGVSHELRGGDFLSKRGFLDEFPFGIGESDAPSGYAIRTVRRPNPWRVRELSGRWSS